MRLSTLERLANAMSVTLGEMLAKAGILPDGLWERLDEAFLLYAFDMDSTLTGDDLPVSPGMAGNLFALRNINPPAALAVISGASVEKIDERLIRYLKRIVKKGLWIAGDGGGRIFAPDSSRAAPDYFMPLVETEKELEVLKGRVEGALRRSGVVSSRAQMFGPPQKPAALTVRINNTVPRGLYHFAAGLREELKEAGYKIHSTSMAVEVSRVDKKDALMYVAPKVAGRHGLTVGRILSRTLAVGDQRD